MAVSAQKRAFSANTLCLKRWSVCGCTVLYLCHFVLAPEAGVVERCVSMLVDCIGVCFALNQLAFAGHKERKLNKKASFSPLRRCKQTHAPGPLVTTPRVSVCTLATMSLCPWLEARCSGVSSPRFITFIRAPLMMSMSTTPLLPSLHAQWRGLKPWSSLRQQDTQREWKSPSVFKLW